VDALMARKAEGKLQLHLDTRLVRIDRDSVTFKVGAEPERTIPNDMVFEMIGAELPLAFFKRIGIKLEGTWDAAKWLTLAAVFVFVYSLYALKKFPEAPYSWPFYELMGVETFNRYLLGAFSVCFLPFRWLFTAEAYENIRATPWFQQGYLYSLAYTVVMAVFGTKALLRWSNIARDNRYQKWRYISLIGFQVVFFLVANVIAVQALSIQHAWRAWGLYQPWPLFFNTFHWWGASDPRAVLAFFIGSGLVGTFVVIQLLSRWHGKRFCTWICGCGGLAETLGDRWRHLAAKGKRSRAWEFQGALVLVAAAIVTIVTVGAYGTRANNAWGAAYSYVVDFWLVAVIPIALYPFFGGKVWCRYWCPLAAWNQILARAYGRLQIESNDKCISCTQCSKFCQVGVDVMAFAKNQAPFDNANSSCIQCGICIDVCPMNVLQFSLKDGQKRLDVVGH
jgi:ferredoxin